MIELITYNYIVAVSVIFQIFEHFHQSISDHNGYVALASHSATKTASIIWYVSLQNMGADMLSMFL